MYLTALLIALAQAAEYPVLQTYVSDCHAAGILAGSAAAAYWVAFHDCSHSILLYQCVFFILAAILSGIRFEIRTELFTKWTRMLDATLKERKNSAVPRGAANICWALKWLNQYLTHGTMRTRCVCGLGFPSPPWHFGNAC